MMLIDSLALPAKLARLDQSAGACDALGRSKTSVADANMERPARDKPPYKLPVL